MADVVETTQEQVDTPAQAPNNDELFARLEAVLDKRMDGLTKSVLKDNGVDEAEVGDLAKAYKAQKQAKADDLTKSLDEANKRIAELTKQIDERNVSEAFTKAIIDSGVDAKTMPYVLRLCDKTDILVNGQVDNEKVNNSIKQVLDDMPMLKASANANKGFVPVGAETPDSDKKETATNNLRNYFGLK